jgi:Plasmid pRiA4b ORF-3-like protein
MAVYRFKVYFEDDESIIREIEIKSTQTFEDFHNIIQSSIGFDSAHPTSFFVSSDTWRRGKEIIFLQKKHSTGLKGIWMHETKIATFVEDPHQKFIYEFDPDGGNWILMIELMKIIPDASVTYPRVNKTTGAAPAQYKVTSPEEIPPVEEEDEAVAIIDDSEDKYIHPEEEHHFDIAEEDEPVPRHVVKEVAAEMSEDEAIEEATEEDEGAIDDEDESAEQQEEDFA